MNIECDRCGQVIAVYRGTHPIPTTSFLCPPCADAPDIEDGPDE